MSLWSLWIPWTFTLMWAGALGSGIGGAFAVVPACPVTPVPAVVSSTGAGGTGAGVVVVTSWPAATVGSAIAAARVVPATRSETRYLPITPPFCHAEGRKRRGVPYGTSLARSARTGTGNRSAVTTASHAV